MLFFLFFLLSFVFLPQLSSSAPNRFLFSSGSHNSGLWWLSESEGKMVFDDRNLWRWSLAELNYLCPFPASCSGDWVSDCWHFLVMVVSLIWWTDWFSPCSGSKCSSRTVDPVADCHLHVSLIGALAELTVAWLTLCLHWWTLDRSTDCWFVCSRIGMEEDVTADELTGLIGTLLMFVLKRWLRRILYWSVTYWHVAGMLVLL